MLAVTPALSQKAMLVPIGNDGFSTGSESPRDSGISALKPVLFELAMSGRDDG